MGYKRAFLCVCVSQFSSVSSYSFYFLYLSHSWPSSHFSFFFLCSARKCFCLFIFFSSQFLIPCRHCRASKLKNACCHSRDKNIQSVVVCLECVHAGTTRLGMSPAGLQCKVFLGACRLPPQLSPRLDIYVVRIDCGAVAAAGWVLCGRRKKIYRNALSLFVICYFCLLFFFSLWFFYIFFHLDAVCSAVACVPASAQRLFWMHIKLFLLHCVIISDRCMFRVVSWKMNQNCFNHEKFVISTHVLWVISSSFVKFHAISAAHPKPSIDEWCEHKATAHKWIMNTFIQMNVAKWS